MARLCESEVRAKLSRQELCAEAIYQLLRLGKMDKETFTARMSALDRCGPDGAVGACYVTWMLLRNAPPSPERDASRSASLLGSPYLEGGGSRFVLGKLIHVKNNTASKRLLVRESVLGAFRAIEWLLKRSLFMKGAKIDLARRSRVDVEAFTE